MQVIRDYRPEPIPEEKQTEVISVAVAVYNSDAFLERAIESILNQTYRNLEVILVDDGSTDRCPGICDRYAKQDSRVRVIHKKKRGPFFLPQRGDGAGHGDLPGFCGRGRLAGARNV